MTRSIWRQWTAGCSADSRVIGWRGRQSGCNGAQAGEESGGPEIDARVEINRRATGDARVQTGRCSGSRLGVWTSRARRGGGGGVAGSSAERAAGLRASSRSSGGSWQSRRREIWGDLGEDCRRAHDGIQHLVPLAAERCTARLNHVQLLAAVSRLQRRQARCAP